jgi:hypothetical protein
VFLLIKEGIGKSTKSKGGLEGSMPQPVGGWVCYKQPKVLGPTHYLYGSLAMIRP